MARRRKPRRVRAFELPAKFVCFFDGCCEPINPGGTAGLGAVVFEDGKRVWECSRMIPASPTTSNNVAEYSAFLSILDYLIERDATKDRVIIHGDSKLVIEQVFGTWKIHGGHYKPMALEAREKIKAFKNVMGAWIPRDENGIADELSKAEVKKAGVTFRIQPEAA